MVFARIHCNFKYLVGLLLHYFSDDEIILILWIKLYRNLAWRKGVSALLLVNFRNSSWNEQIFHKVCVNTFLCMIMHDALCFVLEGSSFVRLD